jgi:hypothetical protein
MSIWSDLAAPFPAGDVEWRVGAKSKAGTSATLLCYLNARAVMDRLDAVVGPGAWTEEYRSVGPEAKPLGFICRLSVKFGDHAWVAKEDVADVTDIEALKGGFSSALKRAAVKWGVGRYLYNIEARYHPIVKGYGPNDKAHVYCGLGEGKGEAGHILIPTLPAWALPAKPGGGLDRSKMLDRIVLLEEWLGPTEVQKHRLVHKWNQAAPDAIWVAYGKALAVAANREPGSDG